MEKILIVRNEFYWSKACIVRSIKIHIELSIFSQGEHSCYHNTEWDGKYYPTTNLEKITMLASTTEYLFYLF